MANNVGWEAYARYEFLDMVAYECYKYLMENDELIWKLIKYDTPDAWNMSDLTRSEKAALIYNGQDDLTVARAFMDLGQPDVWVKENTIIRISPAIINPENRTIGDVGIQFEVYSHWKINHLTNYKTRIDMVAKQFIKVFNGANVGGVGRLFFDKLGSFGNRSETGGQLPFKGRWIIMSNKMK